MALMKISHQQDSPANGPILKPAAIYFALAFGVGFLLGPIRMFVLTPRIGAVAAVLVEAPFILTASYFIARWVLGRFTMGPSATQRLSIGVMAFVMLMSAEFLLTVALGKSPQEFVLAMGTLAGGIGLVGQVVFAFIPLLVRKR
jgi:hypothetical protein